MQRPTPSEQQPEGLPLVSLLKSGDLIEQETWPQLQGYLSRYEPLWQMHVEPLRAPGSIYFRDGIDEDFQIFAMNHYTAYVNLARAFEKIESKSDDLKFAEEIWSNLQRATELAGKETEAFSKIHRECTRKEPRVNTEKLGQLEQSIKKYRNLLHDPMLGTVKDRDGTRLIPRRDTMQKYSLWTDVMYHREDSDFVPVQVQLRGDFGRVCGVLQDLWKQLEEASEPLVKNRNYLSRRSAGKVSTIQPSTCNQLAASGTANSWFGPQSPSRN